jgi:hypothetical protein
MDGARVHLCNAGFHSAAQYVEAGCERPQQRRRVHVCNRAGTSLCVAFSLHRAIALPIRRMCRAVLTPVILMTDPPSCLRSSLVVAIVGVASEMLSLPASPPFSLARSGRTIPLIGDLQKWMKSVAAGEAKAGRFHGCAPWKFNHVARSRSCWRVVRLGQAAQTFILRIREGIAIFSEKSIRSVLRKDRQILDFSRGGLPGILRAYNEGCARQISRRPGP